MRPFLGLALLACVGIGFWAGRLTTSTGASPRSDRGRAAAEAPPAPERPATPAAPAEERPSAKTLLEHEGGPVVDAEIARRAAAIREAALQAAGRAEETARRQVEQEIARERALLEDAARGGTMELMRRLHRDWTPPWEMISSPERFSALFARRTSGNAVDGVRVDRETVLRDGDILQFPPGRHDLDVRWLHGIRPFPKDIVVEGRGMDHTLLVLTDDLRIGDEVHSLTIRDLTLHCDNNSLERMRSNPYTLRLERCRVIAFDTGAGGSKMLSGRVGAFYATDCRIEGGFGRSPGSGRLFDVRGAFVARLERCVVVGPLRGVYMRGQAAQYFVDCRFERMPSHVRRYFETGDNAVRFEDCTFDYLPEPYSPGARRSVTEINSVWGEARRGRKR